MTMESHAETMNTTVTEPPMYSKKIVVVGDGGCGKTCLLISYAEGRFPEVSSSYSKTTLRPKVLIDGTEIRADRFRELHHTHKCAGNK